MNQQDSKKRTIISFGIALVTALMCIYIQNCTQTEVDKDQPYEAKASPIEGSTLIETLN